MTEGKEGTKERKEREQRREGNGEEKGWREGTKGGEEMLEGSFLDCSNYTCAFFLKIFTAYSQMVSSLFHFFIQVQVTHTCEE